MAPLSLTWTHSLWSDLKRSIQVTQVFILLMDRKSYMRFHLVQLSMTLSDLERSNRG